MEQNSKVSGHPLTQKPGDETADLANKGMWVIICIRETQQQRIYTALTMRHCSHSETVMLTITWIDNNSDIELRSIYYYVTVNTNRCRLNTANPRTAINLIQVYTPSSFFMEGMFWVSQYFTIVAAKTMFTICSHPFLRALL